MATIHITEADAARDFAGLMANVHAGFADDFSETVTLNL